MLEYLCTGGSYSAGGPWSGNSLLRENPEAGEAPDGRGS
jgi:hypothetical protein